MDKVDNFNRVNENVTKTAIEQLKFKIDYKKLLNFDPTNRDGLVMFGLYIGIIMFMFKKYAIGICFGCISMFLYFTKKEPIKEPCRESSTDNPHQNVLWDNDGLKACPTDKKVQQENFEENLYRNETDLFDRKSMQGFYYTIQDEYPNKIGELIKAMDSNGRCKAEGINCKYVSFFLQ
jgi:hypothetical protein